MENLKQPLVSVIVPIYKVETYINRCIDSIITQTYANLEIILVDDGSPDKCGEICDNYALQDRRIKVIHKENGGLSDARNVAIDKATGDFFTFIDSDDYVDCHYVEYLYKVMEKTEVDCVLCDFEKFSKEPMLTKNIYFCDYKIFSSLTALEMILYQNKLVPSAWAKLYKREVFNNIRYPNGMLYEDLAIIYDVMKNCSTIAFLPLKLYFYFQRPNSILGEFYTKRLDVLDVVDGIVKKCEIENPSLISAAKSRKLSANFNMILLMPNTLQYKKQIKKCWGNIKKLRTEMFFSTKVRLKNKIGILISLGGLHFFRLFKYKV